MHRKSDGVAPARRELRQKTGEMPENRTLRPDYRSSREPPFWFGRRRGLPFRHAKVAAPRRAPLALQGLLYCFMIPHGRTRVWLGAGRGLCG
jgi:hypothetical protein